MTVKRCPSRLSSFITMYGIFACCTVYVVLFISLPGVYGLKRVGDGNRSRDVIHKHMEDWSHRLRRLNLSAIHILERMREHEDLKRLDFRGVQDVLDTSPECSDGLSSLLERLAKAEMWAISMIDASSVLSSGLFVGNLVDLGEYDECLDQISGDENVPFIGQHCMITLKVNFVNPPNFGGSGVMSALGNSLSYSFALCLPSLCPANMVNETLSVLAREFNKFEKNVTISFYVPDDQCHTKNRPPWTTAEIVGLSVTLVLVAIAVIATILEVILLKPRDEDSDREPLSKALQLVSSFSMISNGKKLLNTDTNDENIQVLHSLKFLCIGWVSAGHCFKLTVQAPLINLLKVADYIKHYSSMLILNAPLSVDVFFVISGILNTYSYLNTSSRGSKTLLGHFIAYIHRYIRLTPAYALMILATATWLYRVGDGPIWDQVVGKERDECTNSWWLGLLYVNNYIQPNHENCMMQSWYLSADMQMFWVSPLVLYSLWRWPRLGVFKLIVLAIVSLVIAFLVAFIYQIKAPIPATFDQVKVKKEMAEFYFPTHTKMVSYVMGMVGGYVLHLTKRKIMSFKLNLMMNIGAWLIATGLALWSVFGAYPYFQLDSPYHRWESSLYLAFFRLAWSIGVVWFIVACSTDHGGFVQQIFCWKAWMPLGRLTYCIYLTHASVILYTIGSLREPQYFSYYTVFVQFVGEFLIAIFLAVILTLTIEAPVLGLEKVLGLRSGGRPRKPRERHSTAESNGVQESIINLPNVLSTTN